MGGKRRTSNSVIMRNLTTTQIDNGYMFEYELPEGDVQVVVTYYDTVTAEIVNDAHQWAPLSLTDGQKEYFIDLKNDFIKKRKVVAEITATIKECNYKVQKAIEKALKGIENPDLHSYLFNTLKDMKSAEIDTTSLEDVYHDLYKCQKSEITI